MAKKKRRSIFSRLGKGLKKGLKAVGKGIAKAPKLLKKVGQFGLGFAGKGLFGSLGGQFGAGLSALSGIFGRKSKRAKTQGAAEGLLLGEAGALAGEYFFGKDSAESKAAALQADVAAQQEAFMMGGGGGGRGDGVGTEFDAEPPKTFLQKYGLILAVLAIVAVGYFALRKK